MFHKRNIFYPEINAFGGEERAILALSKYLHTHNVEHRVVCYYDRINFASYAEWPLEVVQLRPRNFGPAKIIALQRFLNQLAGSSSEQVFLVGLQSAYHAGPFTRVKYSLRISDTPSLLSPAPTPTTAVKRWYQYLRERMRYALARQGIRKAACVIATSRYLAKEINDLYGAPAVILPIGGKKLEQAHEYRKLKPRETLRFLSVSRIEHNKRIDWILQSLKELASSKSSLSKATDWKLDIVGNGSQLSYYQNLTRDLGLSEHLVYHGFVTDLELEKIYSQAHIFLMPARQGFGVPALEALERKIPVIVHRESGVSEILEETPWAELFDGEVKNLTIAMKKMIERVLEGSLSKETFPTIPTEDKWAEQVSKLLRWVI